MSQRVQGGGCINGATVQAAAADLSSAGAKLTYTCPAGRQAIVRQLTCLSIVAGGTLQPKVTVGGVTTTLAIASATFSLQTYLCLNAGDSVALVASGTGAGATNDLTISAEEFLAV